MGLPVSALDFVPFAPLFLEDGDFVALDVLDDFGGDLTALDKGGADVGVFLIFYKQDLVFFKSDFSTYFMG